MNHKNDDTQQLQGAFEMFNRVSQKLSESYNDLEAQVTNLSAQLAAAHSERLKQLAEKERLAYRLEALLDAMPAGIIVLDDKGTVMEMNPAAVELLDSGMIGKTWGLIAQKYFRFEGDALRTRDGRWVSLTIKALGAEPGSIVLITDITENRQLQDTVNRQQRLTSLGEMMAGLAHQVRTPLASALLYLSNMKNANVMAADRIRYSEKARDRLLHLERMVNEMLLFVRGGSGESECFGLQEFVVELQQMIEPVIRRHHGCLDIVNDAYNAELRCNRDALLSAFQNIVDNAIDACTHEPVLAIHISNKKDQVEFRFTDNGPGIPFENLEQASVPFFTTKNNGTGLGLAVVNTLVNSYGGDMSVANVEPSGCRVTVSIPWAARNGTISEDAMDTGGNILEFRKRVLPADADTVIHDEGVKA